MAASNLFVPALVKGPDRRGVIGMALHQEGDRLVPIAAPVLLDVPFAGTDGGQEPLHPGFVVEELAIEMARVPPEQDIADVEHDTVADLVG